MSVDGSHPAGGPGMGDPPASASCRDVGVIRFAASGHGRDQMSPGVRSEMCVPLLGEINPEILGGGEGKWECRMVWEILVMLVPAGWAVTPRSSAWLCGSQQRWDRSALPAPAAVSSPCLERPFVTPCLSALRASELRALGGHNCVYFVVFLCVTSLHFHFSFPVEPCFPPVSALPALLCSDEHFF